MKKNGFQFYLLVIISPGLGTTPPAPQGPSYIPRERTLPRTTILDSLQQLFHSSCAAPPSFSQTILQVFQLPHYLLLLLPSLVITSNESLCHTPNLSTTRGMKTIPSDSHLSLYFPILILKACWTSFSSSLATCPASS